MRAVILATLACWAISDPARAASPGWRVYADCAAAYLANARIVDPGRPAAMTAQVSDVADDYAKAARARYRRQAAGSASAASRAVATWVDRRASDFARQPREAVERVIDSCPQPEE
jgi:hypothetical protein